MEIFEPYGHAIVVLALIGAMGLVMSPVVGARKAAAGLAPGADPEADYGSSVYRWHRAHQNLVEDTAFFVSVTVAAILAGASPLWVNVLASVFLLARVLMLIVHVRGIGRANAGPRSIVFGLGMASCAGLALLAIAEVF